MMRSMFSGVSSLRVHQTRMDVIANNIANVNTVGFKSQRATFQDAFYQMLQGASGPDPIMNRAGTNPMQIGLGLSLGSIDNIMTQGASQRTDNPLDLMLVGPGFFIVEGPMGRAFTRAGNVSMDRQFNLHINGMMLMGWNAEERDGVFEVNRGDLTQLSLAGVQSMAAQSTNIIELIGNLNVGELEGPAHDPDPVRRTLTIFDSLGHTWTMDIYLRYHPGVSGAGTRTHSHWTYWFGTDAVIPDGGQARPGNAIPAWRDNIRENPDGTPVQPGWLDITTGPAGTSAAGEIGTIRFDHRGTFAGAHSATAGVAPAPHIPDEGFPDPFLPWQLNIMPNATAPGSINPAAGFGGGGPQAVGTLTVQTTGLSQRADAHTIRAGAVNGNRPGRLADISVGGDGTIAGRFTNGLTRIIGQIPVALFDNPAGLERGGSNLWFQTVNSGEFDGAGTVGEMVGGALEMSNVDLANEFTEMITTQRGFQAASRTITVSDEMLQELVNLRR